MNIFENQIVLEGRRAASLSVSGTAASTPLLEPGLYAVWATVDTHISVDVNVTVAETVTTSDGFRIKADSSVMPVRVTRSAYLAGIAGEAGTLYYHKVG